MLGKRVDKGSEHGLEIPVKYETFVFQLALRQICFYEYAICCHSRYIQIQKIYKKS